MICDGLSRIFSYGYTPMFLDQSKMFIFVSVIIPDLAELIDIYIVAEKSTWFNLTA